MIPVHSCRLGRSEMRIAIIGGGAAGATAAQFARKQSRDAEITVLEAGPYPEYSRCGLPLALSGDIPSFENLVEFTQEWFQRNKIDLRLGTKAVGVDIAKRQLEFEGPGGQMTEPFDSLVFASGAIPSLPMIEGIMRDGRLRAGVFQFRGMDDAKALRDWLLKKRRKVLVVGAGLVGLEVADALRRMRHEVVVAEFLDSALPMMIDPDMTDSLVSAMASAGAGLRLSAAVEAVVGEDSITGARIKHRMDGSAEQVDCDTVILATGQKPSNDLAQRIGCALGRGGHIKIDSRCETIIKGVYAIGDCSQYVDLVTGAEMPAGLGTLAVKMGEIAGRNAAGGGSHLPKGFLSARVTRIFGLEIAATGPLSSALTGGDFKFIQTRTKGSTLPFYYPGGKDVTVKLTASAEDGRIFSCQIVGEMEAGLRIDVISSLIIGGLRAIDLAQLENSYAPPVKPCVDVLTVAAQGILIKLERSKPA